MGRKERRQVWTDVAKDLGGEHHLPTKWYRGDEWILATIQNVPVKLDTYVVSTGKSTQTFTRVAAEFAHGPGPRMKVYKEGIFASIGTVFGIADIAVGDAAFDKAFVVRADRAALARRLLSPEVIRRLMTLTHAFVESKPERVSLVVRGRWEDREAMKAGMHVIGELAASDIYGEAALRAVGALHKPSPFDIPRAELDTGTLVTMTAADRGERLVMEARTGRIAHDPLRLEVVDGRCERASELSQAAQVHVQGAGSGVLLVDEHGASFTWNELELDPARLRAGADLLGAMATAQAGVYR
jgi:hypothetical protein